MEMVDTLARILPKLQLLNKRLVEQVLFNKDQVKQPILKNKNKRMLQDQIGPRWDLTTKSASSLREEEMHLKSSCKKLHQLFNQALSLKNHQFLNLMPMLQPIGKQEEQTLIQKSA